jgi:NTP pyrophosphatase (non-canonical NTP hydrolase)
MIDECVDDSGRWFPGKAQRIENLTLCMAGEVGEVANIVKKIVRGSLTLEQTMDKDFMTKLGKDTLPEEIIDVLTYLCNLMGHEAFEDVDWTSIWYQKRLLNESRFGDHRSESQQYLEKDACGQDAPCGHAPNGVNHPEVGSGITLSQSDQWGR